MSAILFPIGPFYAPSHVVIAGCTYTLSYYDYTYSIHQILHQPSGFLFYGAAIGGLSGSDVFVLLENRLNAVVTGMTDNTLQKEPVCTVAGHSLVFSTNIPTMALARQFIMSPRCVILEPLSTTIHVALVVISF
jgi:hypothetical protein